MSLLLNHRLKTTSNLIAFMDYLRDHAMPSQLSYRMIEAISVLERVYKPQTMIDFVHEGVSTKALVNAYLRTGGSAHFARHTLMEYAWAHFANMVTALEAIGRGEGVTIARNAFGYDQSLIDESYEAYVRSARNFARARKGIFADAKSYTAYASRLVKAGGMHAVRSYNAPARDRMDHVIVMLDDMIEFDYLSYLQQIGENPAPRVTELVTTHIGMPSVGKASRVAQDVSRRSRNSLRKLVSRRGFTLQLIRRAEVEQKPKEEQIKQAWRVCTHEILERVGSILH